MFLRKSGPDFCTRSRVLPTLLSAVTATVLAGGLTTDVVAQATKPAPATPIDVKKAELGGTPWDPQWDTVIEKAIPPEMLSMQVPHDVRHFCPRFYSMNEVDKRAFWAYFFQALAGAEACLEPTSRVKHSERVVSRIDPVTGKIVRSEGLLQVSYWDQRRYGCEFDWQRDKNLKADDPSKTILQPRNNLECGIKILENQIIDQHKPLITRKSYWAPLQPGNYSHQNFLKEMTNPPAACGIESRSKIAKNKTTQTVQQVAQEKQFMKAEH
jgi:hypothetical protein